MATLSVSEAARRLGARPKDISDLFYRRLLRDDLCPIVGGRRLIPEEYLEIIVMALKRAGRPVRAGAIAADRRLAATGECNGPQRKATGRKG